MNTVTFPDDLRSIPEAAALALVSQPTIHNWIKRGDLPVVRFHGHKYVKEADLYRLMVERVFKVGQGVRQHYPELAERTAMRLLGRPLLVNCADVPEGL